MEIKELIYALRPGNGVLAAIGVFTGFTVARGAIGFNIDLAFAMLAAFFITGAGNVINDYFDFEIDKKLGKNIVKNFEGKTLFAYSMFLFAVGLIFTTGINYDATLIALFVSILLIVYSGIMQNYKFLGNIVVSIGTAATLIFGATIMHNYSIVIWFAISAFFANIAREIIKDTEDMKGDKGAKKTLPMLIGVSKTGFIVFAAYLLAVLVALYVMIIGIVTGILYPLLLAAASIVFFTSWKFFAKKEYNKAQKFSKLGMAIALLAFLGAVI